MELYDLAFWGLHVMGSKAVAAMGMTIWSDPLMPGTHGIILDSCSRVYVGGSAITVAGNAITVRTSTGVHLPLPCVEKIVISTRCFILLHGTILVI